MKSSLLKSTLALAAVSLFGANFVSAQDEKSKPPRPDRQAIMERFDADGNGRLDPAERQAAREAMGKRRHRARLQQFDTDGDGTLNDAERAAAAAHMRERVSANPRAMERLDTDGDGVLSDAEWEVGRARFMERMEKRRSGGPRGEGKSPKRKE